MLYEVEMKFRVSDHAPIAEQIQSIGGTFAAAETQVDTYMSHPCRDFAETDEAFRIRNIGDRYYVTYKGPKIDSETKTRKELEFSIVNPAESLQLYQALGFCPVDAVKKTRQLATVNYHHWPISIGLDNVDGLGMFVELETLTSEDKLPAARSAVKQLAGELGLTNGERRSYLNLLQQQASHHETHGPTGQTVNRQIPAADRRPW